MLLTSQEGKSVKYGSAHIWVQLLSQAYVSSPMLLLIMCRYGFLAWQTEPTQVPGSTYVHPIEASCCRLGAQCRPL